MKTRIKICGLRRKEDIDGVNEASPDYCGFILNVPASRRSIDPEQLGMLMEDLDPAVVPTGVFVNEETETILRIVRERHIRMVQLHGQESEEMIREIQQKAGIPVIKAFSVKEKKDVEQALGSPADYLLFDCGSGGTGKTFDWSCLEDVERPYFLAGGIGTHNMEEALTRFHPFAIDLSSSVETDGVKDRKKVAEAVQMLRSLTSI
nr:phosphoribosylanthranilate isomerase [uncultured Sellimonas sp.]